MRILHLTLLLLCATVCSCYGTKKDINLVGEKFDFQSTDTIFKDPFIDIDEWRDTPIRHRYVHGGFNSNNTRFSFYFPEKKEYDGRFFQYITPFPDSENSSQAMPAAFSPINFAVSHGAYFIETNCGGRIDFTKPEMRDPTIGAYRANAACAEFSREVAKKLFDCDRPYGYCYGGSGGAYRTVGGIESTQGVWDGAVPFVMGSSVAIPNVFTVRMYAMRVLKDKFPQIVDALEPGGSGDMYAGLNEEERQALEEVTRMGFPPKSWFAHKRMDVHGFLVLYKAVVMSDQSYFNEDFWHKPGYLGANPTASLLKARLQKETTITESFGQEKGEELGLVDRISEEERGTADLAWKSAGSEYTERPVAYRVKDIMPEVGFLGGDLIILSGKAKGEVLQITKAEGDMIALAPTNSIEVLAKIAPGDRVEVDNSNFLAAQTYHRHQVPTKDFYVWDQFRDKDGNPIYPQRPMLLGPMFTMGAAGCLPTGKINSKVILVCSLLDREAFPWQGDWYRNKVKENLGDETDNNFRLWYTDHGVHGGVYDDPTQTVNYMNIGMQALLDVSAWAEKGIAPSPTTNYQIVDGQVVIPETAAERKGIQGAAQATINGKKRADVSVAQEVTIHVVADVPAGQGKVVGAEWCIDDSKEYTLKTDLQKAKYSADGSKVEFETTISYDKPGTYFPTVRIASQRNGDPKQIFTRIENIDRVRVVVK